MWHIKYKVMLVYRTPDADIGNPDNTNTKKLFQIIDVAKPNICLGDFNLNYDDEKIHNELEQICTMKQIILQHTRVAPAKNNNISKTIIDHVWVRLKLL